MKENKIFVNFHEMKEETHAKIFPIVFDSLSINEKEKVQKFKNANDRYLSAISKYMIKKIFQNLQIPGENYIQIKFNKYGKPFVDSDFFFNVSHSERLIVCAFTKTDHVGIDIEYVKPINITDFIDVLTSTEQHLLNSSADVLDAFYELWTQKESILKASGTGLSVSPKMIKICNNVGYGLEREWHLHKIDVHPSYWCTIASPIKNPEIVLSEFCSF